MEPGERDPGQQLHESGDKEIAQVCKTLRPQSKGTIIVNNNLTPETAAKALNEGYADLACFGRYFISNSDFVTRVQNDWNLKEWDPTIFYVSGEKDSLDYQTYQTYQLETKTDAEVIVKV